MDRRAFIAAAAAAFALLHSGPSLAQPANSNAGGNGNGNANGVGNGNGGENGNPGNGNENGNSGNSGNNGGSYNGNGSENGNNGNNGNHGNGSGRAGSDDATGSALRSSQPGKVGGDHDVARLAVESGAARPLAEIVETAKSAFPGEVLDARLVTVRGYLLYELKVLSGRTVRKVYFYARSGLPVASQ